MTTTEQIVTCLVLAGMLIDLGIFAMSQAKTKNVFQHCADRIMSITIGDQNHMAVSLATNAIFGIGAFASGYFVTGCLFTLQIASKSICSTHYLQHQH